MTLIIISIIFGGILAVYWQHFKMWRLNKSFDRIELEEARLEASLKHLATEILITNTCKGGKLGIKRALNEVLSSNHELTNWLKMTNRSCRFIEMRLKSKLRLSKRTYWKAYKKNFFAMRKELRLAIKKADIAIEAAELILLKNEK